MAAVFAAAIAMDAPRSVLAQAGWGVALQLWFIPIYLVRLVLAVPLIGAWQRMGWWSLAVCVAGVAGIDLLVRVADVPAAGLANYVLAPAGGFLLGIAWRAGAFARPAVPAAMAVCGAAGFVLLVALAGYPRWMLGVPGAGQTNTTPPNLALAAYASAQVGLVLLLEPALRRWLHRPRVWGVVIRGNRLVLTLYLWHMVPVLIVAALAARLGAPAGPATGTAAWWALRPAWIALLALILAGVVALVGRFELPRPPLPSLHGPVASVLLLACAALAGYSLSRLALNGFAPSGTLAVGPIALYAAGAIALSLAARPPCLPR